MTDEAQSDYRGQRGSRLRRWTRKALIASVLAHLLFGIVAAFIVAFRNEHKPEAIFSADPPPRPRLEPRKLEMKVKVQDMQKRSARPKLQPRLTAMAPSDIALPDIKKVERKVDRKVQRNFAKMGLEGIGTGIGGGLGTGMGGGISFFGLKGEGNRHLFVVDLSFSMSAKQLDNLKEELVKSLNELRPGMSYQIICFAGPVWFMGDEFVKRPRVYGKYVLRGESGQRYEWEVIRGGRVEFKGGMNKLPRPGWKEATPVQIQEAVKSVQGWRHKADLVQGTTWIWPLRTALNMNPQPDVIYFMTDGAAQRMEESVEEVTSLNKKGIPINTISMVAKADGQKWLKILADRNNGAFTNVR